MEKESSFGLIRALTRETFSKTISTDKVSIYGQTEEFTTVNGSTIRWRAMVRLLGVTDVDTSDNTKMTRSMVTVLSSGQTEESTSESGSKVSSTAKVYISRRVKRGKESGRWVRE